MDVSTLKRKELLEYAESLGCSVNARDTVAELRVKIAAATGTTIEPTGEEMDKKLEEVGRASGAEAGSGNQGNQVETVDEAEKELSVIFHPGANGDTGNVYFSINGKAMSLPRNKEVKVKKKYLDMLSKECVGYAVIQVINDQGKLENKQIKKPVYTFDIVG